MNKFVVAAVLVLSGCQLSADSYCSARLQAECKKEQRCGRVSNQVDCSTYTTNADCLSLVQVALDDKRITWDSFAAARCVDAIEHEACDTYTGESKECAALYVGKHKLNEGCGGCAAGLFCAPVPAQICGVCQKEAPVIKHPGPGEACSGLSGGVGTECSRGNSCAGAYGNATCKMRLPDSEACTLNFHTGFDGCGEASRCVDSVCTHKVELGEVCDPLLVNCLDGLWCENSRCALKRPVGAACEGGWQCLSGYCFENACTLTRAIGASCDVEAAPCSANADCIDGICVARARPGEPCSRNVGCTLWSTCEDSGDGGTRCVEVASLTCW